MIRKFVPMLVVAASLGLPLMGSMSTAVAADAAKGQPTRVRGQVVDATDSVLTVKTREGETAKITLADGWKIASVAPYTLEDIKPGDYVGIASLPKSQGGDGALEVLVFPAAMKGMGEGSYGWDLKPGSSMTNASVSNAVKDVNGKTLTLSYKGGEKKINVEDKTPVVTLGPATKDDLKPDATVFVSAEKGADGSLSTHQIVVGKNGLVPPM